MTGDARGGPFSGLLCATAVLGIVGSRPGGTPARAHRRFYEDARAREPDIVLFVVMNRTDEDLDTF